MTKYKKISVGALSFIAVGAVLSAVTIAAVSEERPEGRAGSEADALAAKLEEAVNIEAWNTIGVVEWTFAGQRAHLWDKNRQFVRVRDGELTVWFDIGKKQGVAERDGSFLSGEQLDKALEEAWSAWANDSFWLNPLAKLRDDGVKRELVKRQDGGEGLLVTYTQGGVTPGDSYLWIPGDDGKPRLWKMWTSVIPVGGAPASWEGWIALPGEAWVSTKHDMKAVTLELTDVRGAVDLAELYPEDPFGRLVAALREI